MKFPLNSLIVASAVTAISFAAHAGYPWPQEMPQVQQIAIQLEIDTNEAYFDALDNQRTGYQQEDEALGDLWDLKTAALEFSNATQTYPMNPEYTEATFVNLNEAFLEAQDTFAYLSYFGQGRIVFDTITANVNLLQNAYEFVPAYRGGISIDLNCRYPVGYQYWYAYDRYPNGYDMRCLRPDYWRDPYSRHQFYNNPDYRPSHMRRAGWDRAADRQAAWENSRRNDRFGRGDRRDDRHGPDYDRRGPVDHHGPIGRGPGGPGPGPGGPGPGFPGGPGRGGDDHRGPGGDFPGGPGRGGDDHRGPGGPGPGNPGPGPGRGGDDHRGPGGPGPGNPGPGPGRGGDDHRGPGGPGPGGPGPGRGGPDRGGDRGGGGGGGRDDERNRHR